MIIVPMHHHARGGANEFSTETTMTTKVLHKLFLLTKVHDLVRSGKSQHFLNTEAVFDLVELLSIRCAHVLDVISIRIPRCKSHGTAWTCWHFRPGLNGCKTDWAWSYLMLYGQMPTQGRKSGKCLATLWAFNMRKHIRGLTGRSDHCQLSQGFVKHLLVVV